MPGQLSRHTLALGDVAHHSHKARVALRRVHVLQRDLHRHVVAVLVAMHGLEGVQRDVACHQGRDHGLEALGCELRLDVIGRHGEQLLDAVAHLIDGALVHIEKAERLGVEHKDTVERAVERGAELAELAVELGVVDRDGGAAGHILGQALVICGEIAPRLGAHEGDGAKRAAAGGERQHHRRAQAKLEQDSAQLGVGHAFTHHLLCHHGDDFGRAGADHLGHAGGRGGVGRPAPVELVGQG